MARPILPLIDLRTTAEREGITKRQQTVQAIVNILKTVGAAEQQTLDRITRAISSGATGIEAIAAVAGQKPEFGTGLPGILQRIGGMFQPSEGGIGQGIQQAIIGQAISPKEALTIPQLRAKEAQRTRARPGTAEFEAIAEGPAVVNELEELQDDLAFWQNVYGRTYEKGMLGSWGEIADPETKRMAQERIAQIRKKMMAVLEQLSAPLSKEVEKAPEAPPKPSEIIPPAVAKEVAAAPEAEVVSTEPPAGAVKEKKAPAESTVQSEKDLLLGLGKGKFVPDDVRYYQDFDDLFPQIPQRSDERTARSRLKAVWRGLPDELKKQIIKVLMKKQTYLAVIGHKDLKPYLEKK